MLMYKSQRAHGANEQGFAALIIAIILVTVISLVTLGFARLMRSEQRSALDRQLSSEAFYAAESGVNDANRALQGGYTKAKTNCDNSSTSVDYTMTGSEYLKNTNVDKGNGTKYSCLTINPNPADLQYSSIPVNQATTAIMTGADSTGATASISKLVFSWQDDSGGRAFAGNTAATGYSAGSAILPPASSWTDGAAAITGILRISLTPMPAAVAGLVALDRTSLTNNTYTAFLYPQKSASTTAITSVPAQPLTGNVGAASGQILNGACNTGNIPRYCAVAIDLGAYAGPNFLLHLSSIYRSTSVTVTPYSAGGAKMYIKGAQTVVDSTGKAQDVLKRIQVRIPARNGFDYPEFDVQSANGICKQLYAYPPNNATGTSGSAGNACASL